MEEKQNFRVQFLHAPSNNYLILFIYIPCLSADANWAARPSLGCVNVELKVRLHFVAPAAQTIVHL
ncbi:hypothetical protein [Mesorhizobium sp. AR07]|uniref:hypothetical protein n=1 Tax=Mesorhizobium sp. AR07 TaxID=2865838 RepID=UPI0021604159|nr:hypothetical protein [Mesorhizobium sp. AR07]